MKTKLVACKGCKTEYERHTLHDVEGPGVEFVRDEEGRLRAVQEVVLICGPCYDKWIYGENMEDVPF